MHAAHGLFEARKITHITTDHLGRSSHAGQQKLRLPCQTAEAVRRLLQRS